MMSRRPAALVTALALLGFAPAAAHANGAFPAVSQLVNDPSDPAHLVLRSNFGLLTTRDLGQNWDLLCEAGVGYQNVEPPIAVLDDGVAIAALQDGIAYGSKSECAFARGSGIAGYVADVSRVPGSPHEAVAVSVDLDQNTSQVWRTVDTGKTWTSWGTVLRRWIATTLDVGGNAGTLYVSAVSAGTPLTGSLLYTADAGQTWAQYSIPIAGKLNAPYIAAVAASDANTVYVRLAGTPGQLLVTHDAGQHIEPVLGLNCALDGFALSPDGKLALASSRVDGVWRASTTDLEFTRVSCAKVRCLSWTASGLFACADEFEAGFLVGESPDQGASFLARLHLPCVRGPLNCATTSSVGSVCPAAWPAIAEQLGTDCANAGSFMPNTACPSAAGGSTGSPADAGPTIASARGTSFHPRGGCALAASPRSHAFWVAGCGALCAFLRRLKSRAQKVRRP